ncbi:PREDICTED: putative uncharacterized protein C18orf42 homolog [Tauraco erythrolophus]|nr:PREDICTED: putative uncharacterized protein C18orf42 homolog [Tauraco erythrolophus]
MVFAPGKGSRFPCPAGGARREGPYRAGELLRVAAGERVAAEPELSLSRDRRFQRKCLSLACARLWSRGEKPGTEQDEVKLQNASKQIVQTAILRAVQQVSQESQQKEKRPNSSTSLQLERGKLTKKHEKK